MSKLITVFLLALYALTSSAVPAKRERCTLTLADGSTIEATWMGDETMHFYLADDGRYLQCSEDGIAHFVEATAIQGTWKARRGKRQAARARHNASRRKKAETALTGRKTGLVILVQFPDVPFYYKNEDFQRFFNEEGYRDNINIGSVRDYFREASYGKFDFCFDVIGPVTLEDSLYVYGENNSNGDDVYPATMIAETIQKIDDEVDFNKYDWDGDGEVEQIFVIHAGFDEAQSRRQNDIWSHAWYLSEAKDEGDGNGPVTVDGVTIDSYATSSELRGKTGFYMAGIGTACHEFSHQFGLPDFYDTQGHNFGMNTWSIMDYGEYNGNGGTPAGFTSYERMFCGWLHPTELTEPVGVVNMPPLTANPRAYILRNGGKNDEYLLFENRQKERWDRYLSGHGMLVIHVDYDSLAWAENSVNTVNSHQRMTIIPADNILYAGTSSGDPWPGAKGEKTELSDATLPNPVFYNENTDGTRNLNHTITEIRESGNGLISFIFDEMALDLNTPTIEEAGEEQLYNLAGLQVSPDFRGIVVRKGKKTFISRP